jgi:hypothetical protein
MTSSGPLCKAMEISLANWLSVKCVVIGQVGNMCLKMMLAKLKDIFPLKDTCYLGLITTQLANVCLNYLNSLQCVGSTSNLASD